jgi:hypothetical protein
VRARHVLIIGLLVACLPALAAPQLAEAIPRGQTGASHARVPTFTPGSVRSGAQAGRPYGPAAAGNGQIAARFRELSRAPAVRAFELSEAGSINSPGAVELADLLKDSSSATSFVRQLAQIPLLLSAPSTRRALNAARSHRASHSQVRLIRRTLTRLLRNPAIRRLVRKGKALKRNPRALRQVIETLRQHIKESGPLTTTAGLGSDPVMQGDVAFWGRQKVLGQSSLAAAVSALLGMPEAARYVKSLSPFSLGALAAAESMGPQKEGAHASIEEGQAADACSSEQIDVIRDATIAAGIEGPAQVAQDLGEMVPGPEGVLVALAGGKGKQWLENMLGAAGWSAGAALQRVQIALVDCYVSRIALVPTTETTLTPDRWARFTLNLYGPTGASRFSTIIGRPDTLSIGPSDQGSETAGDSECFSNSGLECHSRRAGTHIVTATLRRLSSSVPVTVKMGPIKSLSVTPDPSTVGVEEETQRFMAKGEDGYGNSVEVPAGGTFPDGYRAELSMAPADGSCSQATGTCTPTDPGTYNAIIRHGDDIQNHAKLEVLPNRLFVTPLEVKLEPGESQAFSLEEVNQRNTVLRSSVPFGTGPGQAHLSLPASVGSCSDAAGTCTVSDSAAPGTYEVQVSTSNGHAVGSATLEVVPASDDIDWSGTLTFAQTEHATYPFGSAPTTGTNVTTFNVTDSSTEFGTRPEGSEPAMFVHFGADFTAVGERATVDPNGSCGENLTWNAGYHIDFNGPYRVALEAGPTYFLMSNYGPNEVEYLPLVPTYYKEPGCPAGPQPYYTEMVQHLCLHHSFAHPLSRSGKSVKASETCSETILYGGGEWAGQDTLEINLVATCVGTGQAPDANWSCKSGGG